MMFLRDVTLVLFSSCIIFLYFAFTSLLDIISELAKHILITLSTFKPLSSIMAASLAINNLIVSYRGTNHQTLTKRQSSSRDEELTNSIYSPAKRARKHRGRINSSNNEKTADADAETVSYP